MGKLKTIGLAALGLFILLVLIGIFSSGDETTPTPDTDPVETQPETIELVNAEPQVVSTSFADYEDLFCGVGATDLKKDMVFDEELKGQYVTWSGRVGSVREGGGSYIVSMYLCDALIAGSIDVTMRPDQKDQLLDLAEGDIIEFTAKLKSRGGIFTDMSATDGIIAS